MTSMLIYIVRRLLAAIPVLLAVSLFVFLMVDISGDPVQEIVITRAASGEPLSQEAIEAIEAELYQDRSVPERYWLWLTGLGDTNKDANGESDIGLLQGQFGPSVRGNNFDIGSEIGDKALTSLRLVGLATFFGIFLGIAAGVISATRQYSKTDHSITFFGFLALAMPVFWFAALIKEAGIWVNDMLANVTGNPDLRPIGTVGDRSGGSLEGYTAWQTFTDIAGHLILPTIVLSLIGYATFSRFQRASMLEVLNSDYVRLARAKGLRNRVVMRRHALRTALIPVLTLVALSVATAIDGAILTETVFQWRGMGVYLVERLSQTDTFAVTAIVLFSGIFVVMGNLIADLLYAVLDPRIRYD
jgi:peptide/nickel transport system permease protein